MPASSSPWICSFARVRGVWVVVIFFVFPFFIFYFCGGAVVVGGWRWMVDGRWLDGWMEKVV